MTQYLLVGSLEPYSGKSGTIVGMAQQLQSQGIKIGYGKPLSSYFSLDDNQINDDDLNFITQTLNLPSSSIRPTLLTLDQEILKKRFSGEGQNNYAENLPAYLKQNTEDLVLIEGGGSLTEGSLFNLSLLEISATLNAPIVLVSKFHSLLLVDLFLAAKKTLGKNLLGVVINDISSEQIEITSTMVKPFLESCEIPVLAMLPKSSLLHSVTVRELVSELNAEVIARNDRLDLMVETIKIGAMNVNSALEYFRQSNNMAVVTGSDRTDIQSAALKNSSTHCLILTGHTPPQDLILNLAQELEIPILAVDLDTLSTVEIIERTFKQVRFHGPVKVEVMKELIQAHFDVSRLLTLLGL